MKHASSRINPASSPLSLGEPAPGRGIPDSIRAHRLADIIVHRQKDAFLRRALRREDEAAAM